MLEVDRLSVVVPPGRTIVDSVSLRAVPGRVTALVGPNGAGKSTLLKCLIGLVKPEKGAILRYGRQDLGALKRKDLAGIVSYLPQSTQAVPSSVYDAVLLGRRPHISWRPGRGDHQICLAALEELGLGPLADKCVSKLSGGEFQKVLIARALVQSTPVLLLDEPINHLDIKNQIEILAEVASLTRRRRLITLVVLHDLNLALRYADDLALLSQGRILYGGVKEHLRARDLSAAYQMDIRIEHFGEAAHVLY